MEKISMIQGLAMLLSMCGIVSIRMFLPTFLYLLAVRFAPVLLGTWTPSAVQRMAETTPEWLMGNWGLLAVGILAVVEIIAVRQEEIREFLVEDFDRFAKPVIALVLAFGFINQETAKSVQDLVVTQQSAGFTLAAIGGIFCAGITSWFCLIRSNLMVLIHRLDPDNGLKLQSLANFSEETVSILALIFLVFLPLFALCLTLVLFGVFLLARKIALSREKDHQHLCPECLENKQETPVSNAAEICPVCHTVQPEICQLGFFGTTTPLPLDQHLLSQHRRDLLRVHKCPACAQNPEDPVRCAHCGKRIWEAGYSQIDYVRRMDFRAILLSPLFFVLSLVPILGFVVSILIFNFMIMRPLRLYQTGFGRFAGKIGFRLLKICTVFFAILFSGIPLIGLLSWIPFILFYWSTRADFLRRTEAYRVGDFIPNEESM